MTNTLTPVKVLNGDISALKQALKRIKYAFTQDKEKCIKKALQKANATMRELVYGSSRLVPSRRAHKSKTGPLESIRDHAEGIHDALEEAPWGCCCPEPHNASLRLESRIEGVKSSEDQTHSRLRFRVAFRSRSHRANGLEEWRETDIVPRDIPPLPAAQPQAR